MTQISVDKIPHVYAQPGDNGADIIVNERFNFAQLYANNAFNTAQSYLNVLKNLFANAQMPEYESNFVEQQLNVDFGNIDGQRPAPPASMSINRGNTPQTPEFLTVQVNDIPQVSDDEVPTLTTEPAFVYEEYPYSSALADALKAWIEAYIRNGGSGLTPAVEAAILARGQDRMLEQNEDAYNEALNLPAAMGWKLPPGSMWGRLQRARNENDRRAEQLNHEITIKSLELEQRNTQFAITSGIQMDSGEREMANQVATRALDAAKSAVDMVLRIYTGKVQAFAEKLRAVGIYAEIEKTKAGVVSSANQALLGRFQAEMEGFKANLQAEISIVETLGKIYGFQIAGYEADAKVLATKVDAQIKEFQGRVQQEGVKGELTLKDAELILKGYLGALGLQQSAAEGVARISAQIAASALSSVNASASISDSDSSSFGVSYGHSESVGNTYSESHSYDENAI